MQVTPPLVHQATHIRQTKTPHSSSTYRPQNSWYIKTVKRNLCILNRQLLPLVAVAPYQPQQSAGRSIVVTLALLHWHCITGTSTAALSGQPHCHVQCALDSWTLEGLHRIVFLDRENCVSSSFLFCISILNTNPGPVRKSHHCIGWLAGLDSASAQQQTTLSFA